MDPSKVEIPRLVNLTAENITKNTVAINSNCPDARMKFVIERLVSHLHDFARETRLSTKEWMAGIEFLTDVGRMCTPVRQEFILLSDVFGLSLLVDAIDHPKPAAGTEGTVLGPFHTDEAHTLSNGDLISHDEAGDPLLVIATVKDTAGKPIEGVKIDVWETDSTGHYDVQRPDHKEPDGRCVLLSDKNGTFWFKAIKPVPYPIPHDGPVGQFLKRMHRHPYRPSHMHFMFEKPGYDHLITALYLRGDPYETSDAVFGVKDSLIVDMPPIDPATADEYKVDTRYAVLRYDFVLVSEQETTDLRNEKSLAALRDLGYNVEINVDGLPVPAVD